MALEPSILKSIKKVLGVDPALTVFDTDIITAINSAFSVMSQLEAGNVAGFSIEDENAVWDDLALPEDQLGLVKTYIYLKARILFDPPSTSYLIEMINNQITEHEWRLNLTKEEVT